MLGCARTGETEGEWGTHTRAGWGHPMGSEGAPIGMEETCEEKDRAQQGGGGDRDPSHPPSPLSGEPLPFQCVPPTLFPPLFPSVPLGARVFWPLCPNLAAALLPFPSAPLTPGTSPGDKRAAT